MPTEKPKRAPKQDRSVQTRQRILDEALRLFAAHGFEGVGIRDVSAAAGVNHGLIKYHFGDKDTLWRESVQQLFERADRELAVPAEMEGQPVERQFEIFIRRYVRYCAAYPEHARLMVQESVRDSERLAWAAKRFIAPEHGGVLPAIKSLIRRGIMPDVEPVLMIYMLSSAAQAPFMLAPELKHTHGVDALNEASVQAHADAMVAVFLGRRGTTST
jgi:AcrR family transcriptional regulator